MTEEEFLAIVVQIKGFLNLYPISFILSDPNDYKVVFRKHILTRKEITSIPMPICCVPENRFSMVENKYVQRI